MDWFKTRPFNRIRFVLDPDVSLANVLDKACEAHGPGAIFYLDEPLSWSGLPDRAVSCLDLRTFANRMANVLRQAGLRPFDRVVIYTTHGPAYFFLALAVIRAGGIAVPVHPGMSLRDLDYYLRHTGARYVVTDPETFDRGLGELARSSAVEKWLFTSSAGEVAVPHVVLESALVSASDSFVPAELAKDSDILIVHTSGTTGFPKGVLCANGAMMSALRTNLCIQPLSRKNRGLIVGPFNHYATHLGLLSAMVGGAPVWLTGKFDPEHVLSTIEREAINVYVGFPDTYLKMYNYGLSRHKLDSMRVWMSAADATHEVHLRAFVEKGALFRVFGKRLLSSVFVDAYGTSEIGFFALARFVTTLSKRFGRMIGRPSFLGPKVKIADAAGRKLGRGRIGRFMVKGKTLFKGYWNDHERLHGVVVDGWWWTGDVGYRDGFGRFHHLDRAVDVIETSEGSVYSLPIEERLLKQAGVGEAVVIGVSSANGEAEPLAIVMPKPGSPEPAKQVLLEVANEGLNGSVRFKRVEIVSEAEIPRGLTGKVLKRQLRERYSRALLPASV